MDMKEKKALLCSKYDDIGRLLSIHNVHAQDREDLLHDIFVNALRSLHKLRDPDKMNAWLWKIARNEVRQYWRNVLKNRKLMRSLDSGDVEAQMPPVDDANYRRLEKKIDRMIDRQELERTLSRLSDKTLDLLHLYYFEGYALREISHIIGENEGTVKSRHARGLIRLRQILVAARVEKKLTEEEILAEVLVKSDLRMKGNAHP